jgi:hypothetical protein
MKNPFIAPLALLACVCLLDSCQKADIAPDNHRLDSTINLLPRQWIATDYSQDPSGQTQVYSIKYDTANYIVDLYLDDTTNANPYDKLFSRYQFNKDGYLVGNLQSGDVPDQIQVVINRGNDNRVNWIARTDIQNNELDTTFYSYQDSADAIIITTTKVTIGDYTDTLFSRMTFSASSQLLQCDMNKGDSWQAFSYNADGSLKKKVSVGNGVESNYEADLSYYISNLSPSEDNLRKYILGRDHFLPDLKELYPFTLFTNAESYSLSNPYQLADVTETYDYGNGETSQDKYHFSYQFNEWNQLVGISINSPDGILYKEKLTY